MSMLLSVTEVATILGCSPRALRARLARKGISGTKIDGIWRIPRESLPFNEEQRQALQQRADSIREIVESALPPQLARTPGDKRRTLQDLAAFRTGRSVLAALRSDPAAAGSATGRAAAESLERALISLGRAWPVFDPRLRLKMLDEARAEVGAAMAWLLMSETLTEPAAAWILTLEEGVLPPLAGMCRAAERRTRSGTRDREPR